MYNFTKGRVPSVIKKLKFDEITPDFHRRVLILGSGESGYSIASKLKWFWSFESREIAILSSQPIHHVKFGQTLYSLKHYEKIDFERPILNDFQLNPLTFDEVISIDPNQFRVTLFGSDYLTYDYLILACGLEVNKENIESFLLKCDESSNNYYNMSNFSGYEKLRENFDLLSENQEFNIICGKDCSRIQEALSLALLFRYKFKKSTINISFEDFPNVFNQKVIESLENYLQSREIKIIFKDKFLSSQILDEIKISTEKQGDLTNKHVFFFAPRIYPKFLENEKFINFEDFDLKTLQNRKYSNVFALGSYLYPDSTLESIHRQSDVVCSNLKGLVENECFNRKINEKVYENENELYVFDEFVKVVKITENGIQDSYFESKKLAWKMRNGLLFRHFYWTRFWPKNN